MAIQIDINEPNYSFVCERFSLYRRLEQSDGPKFIETDSVRSDVPTANVLRALSSEI
jgi:hypothetical protein